MLSDMMDCAVFLSWVPMISLLTFNIIGTRLKKIKKKSAQQTVYEKQNPSYLTVPNPQHTDFNFLHLDLCLLIQFQCYQDDSHVKSCVTLYKCVLFLLVKKVPIGNHCIYKITPSYTTNSTRISKCSLLRWLTVNKLTVMTVKYRNA